MPPHTLPHIEPTIPTGMVFLALTMTDPDAPVAIAGWLTVRRDAPGDPEYFYPPSDEHVTVFLARTFPPGAVASWRVIAYDDIPKDGRTYRDAWHDPGDGKPLAHRMDKARQIHREHMRTARGPKLSALDVEHLRASEQNDKGKQADIVARKQALRDVTAHPGIDAAQTVEELRAVWPPELD